MSYGGRTHGMGFALLDRAVLEMICAQEDGMTAYKVFYKDCYRKKMVLLGTLIERRKGLRGMNKLEAGLKWAKVVFGKEVKDIKRIIVVPKEENQSGGNGIITTK
jgi:hypothetical protein